MGKPVHPALVHFPIAFLFLAFGLDISNHFSSSLPSAVKNYLPLEAERTRMSYYLLCAGLVGSIGAILSGIQQALTAVQKQGLKNADGSVKEKFKAMTAHAVINYAVTGGTAYLWYLKREAARNSVAGKIGAQSYQSTPSQVLAEGFLLAGLGMASNIGGVLSYNFGMGVQIGTSSSKKSL